MGTVCEIDYHLMGNNWFELRLKVPASDFNKVRVKIATWPEEVAKEVYHPQIKAIAEAGAEFIRQVIERETTPTGEARVRRGGNGPGRVKSGKMINAVRSRVRPRANGGISATAGWLTGEPGYVIFQEMGTKNGVEAMDAIGQAHEFMLSELRRVANGGRIEE